jgi:hypothetical protein
MVLSYHFSSLLDHQIKISSGVTMIAWLEVQPFTELVEIGRNLMWPTAP